MNLTEALDITRGFRPMPKLHLDYSEHPWHYGLKAKLSEFEQQEQRHADALRDEHEAAMHDCQPCEQNQPQ